MAFMFQLGNHDQHRVASRFVPELVDGLNFLAHLLPGVGVTYNGEEIGMENTFITWEQCQDPQGINAGADHYLEATRDLERTPFQWDTSTSAGT
jgi:alpha-glucosidase